MPAARPARGPSQRLMPEGCGAARGLGRLGRHGVLRRRGGLLRRHAALHAGAFAAADAFGLGIPGNEAEAYNGGENGDEELVHMHVSF
jgi:hypothetical protein